MKACVHVYIRISYEEAQFVLWFSSLRETKIISAVEKVITYPTTEIIFHRQILGFYCFEIFVISSFLLFSNHFKVLKAAIIHSLTCNSVFFKIKKASRRNHLRNHPFSFIKQNSSSNFRSIFSPPKYFSHYRCDKQKRMRLLCRTSKNCNLKILSLYKQLKV